MSDRRRIALQIRAVVVTYRSERRRLDGLALERFRERARDLLSALVDVVRPDPDLRDDLANAMREVEEDGVSSE